MTVSSLEYEADLILSKIRDTDLRLATGKQLIHFIGEIKSLQLSIEDLRRELSQLQNQK